MIRIVIGALLAAAINGPVDAQPRSRAGGHLWKLSSEHDPLQSAWANLGAWLAVLCA